MPRAAAEVAADAGGMAGFGVANERLRALEELEREIGSSLQSAGARGPPVRAGFVRRGGRGAGPRCFGGARGGTSGCAVGGVFLVAMVTRGGGAGLAGSVGGAKRGRGRRLRGSKRGQRSRGGGGVRVRGHGEGSGVPGVPR